MVTRKLRPVQLNSLSPKLILHSQVQYVGHTLPPLPHIWTKNLHKCYAMSQLCRWWQTTQNYALKLCRAQADIPWEQWYATAPRHPFQLMQLVADWMLLYPARHAQQNLACWVSKLTWVLVTSHQANPEKFHTSLRLGADREGSQRACARWKQVAHHGVVPDAQALP